MHRTGMISRIAGRAGPRGPALHRQGVATTYKLHDRLLSNRRSRSLYARHRPSLDGVQRRIVEDLDSRGCSVISFTDLLSQEAWHAVQRQATEFVDQTERGLAGGAAGREAVELQRRAGKDFLVRKYDSGAVLPLDDAWLDVCTSRLMIDVANDYLRLWSKLEYVDVWYSIPVGESTERRASQLWHRDFDDRHLLKVFLYLVDVDRQTGPFEYLPGSQPGGPLADIDPWEPMRHGRVPEERILARTSPETVRTFTGQKGTMIFCNTSGLHRGGFAETNPRVLATATYCSPASLASLTRRNYALAPGTSTASLDPAVRYALS